MPLSRKRKSTYFVKHSKRARYGRQVNVVTSRTYVSRQGRTDYAMTLIDPTIKVTVRIPDIASYQTATFTNELHKMVTILPYAETANTNNSVAIFPLMPDAYVYSFQGANGVGPGTLSAGSGGFADIPGGGTSGNNFAERYKAARLVSAMLKIQFSGNDTNTAGEIFCAFLPADANALISFAGGALNWNGTGLAGDYPSTTNYNATSIANIKAYCTDWYEGPLKNGICIRYKPQDSESFDMAQSTRLQTTGNFKIKYGTFIVLFNVPGAAGSAGTQFSVDYVSNWEGITKNVDFGIPTGVSSSDPGALAHGINAAAKGKSCFSATAASWQANVTDLLRSVA